MMNHGIHRIHGMVLLAVAALGTSLAVFAADPAITVSARQRYPWNGFVDINFTITGDAGTKYDTSFTAKDMVGNTNIAMRTIRKADGTAANVEGEALYPGTYHWVWDAAADLPDGFQCERVTVAATADEWNPLYMVVDLSGGPDSSAYPVSYLDAVPDGGWSDEYKTTKLVLRRIEPGSFLMCGEYHVTLTKPFYIGVFEVTDKQYRLVTGAATTVIGGSKDIRPAQDISYGAIRGGSNWPSSLDVDVVSFMGKLRVRTALDVDLPTEAQWEYACRAGTLSLYNNGGNTIQDLAQLGRYSGSETAVVGSYIPNAWGLYDMHGNLSEWCLDWKATLSDNVVDPLGPLSGGSLSSRVVRGGDFGRGASQCTSEWRGSRNPSSIALYVGFRICLTLSK